MADNLRLLIERTNLRTVLATLSFIATGIFCLWISWYVGAKDHHATESILREGGAILFASGVLGTVWEFAAKRAFADEVLAKANMSRDLAEAGIETVTGSFQDERIKWDELFKNACKLDMFVAYASTWRNSQIQRIGRLLNDPTARLRVILPDIESEEVVNILSKRFENSAEKVRSEILDAKEFFEHRQINAKGTVEIYFSQVLPLFSFYRFNNRAVFALYNHRKGRISVPSIVCDEDGFLFQYLTDEFQGIIENEGTRKADITTSKSV